MSRSLCALATLLLPFAALAAPAPVPFVSGWDKPVDPDKDCTIRREKGTLTIEMPGTFHEYNLHRKILNAPRLLRDIEGDFEMEVRLRLDCRPSVQSAVKDLLSYVSAGFLIIPPDNFGIAFYRSEYRLGGQGVEAEGCAAMLDQARERGETNGVMTNKHPDWPFKSKPDYVYLRLERQGDLLGIDISPDRETWKGIGGGGFVGLPAKLKVGLAAFSTSTDPSKVVFDQLKITRGKKRKPWEFLSGWDAPVDPDKDCKVRRDKDGLTIEIPGTVHDLDPVHKRFNAPRLFSDLEGSFDLQVRVRINSRPSAQSRVKGQPSFVSAGFLLTYPEGEYAICDRMEYAVSQQGTRPEAYAITPQFAKPRRSDPVPKGKEVDSYAVMKTWIGKAQRNGNRTEWDHGRPRQFANMIWERGWQKWPLPEKADYAYLRLDHRTGWASFFISPDGENWTLLELLPHVPAKGKVGLAAYSTSTEPSKVRFDQLKLARGNKKSK